MADNDTPFLRDWLGRPLGQPRAGADAPDRPDNTRGDPPRGFDDPEAPPARDLPPYDPNWEPSDIGKRIWVKYGEQIRERPDRLWFPHLLIRGAPGDTGARPLWEPVPCWLSPDILLFEEGGEIDLSRAVLRPRVGSRYIVGVHVWNLGRFPAYGVLVRAWWVIPGFSPNATDPRYRPQFIGGTMVDLGDRDSGSAHRIVTLPTPWLVEDAGGGHQCIFACAESFADPRGSDLFEPNADRHVAQRNLSLIRGDEDAAPLLDQLGEMLLNADELTLAVGQARIPSLEGAVSRGMSTSTDVPVGIGPIVMDPSRRVATLIKIGENWFTDRQRPDLDPVERKLGQRGARRRSLGVSRLSQAVARMLGTQDTSAAGLLRSPGIGDPGSAALHLSTKHTGYTVLLHY